MAPLSPSRAYYDAVEEGKRHHASSKTYSGSLLRPHKPFLTEMVERLGCRSALDVGAGKGKQWSWVDPADGKTMEQAWGFDVRKYDPCWPPYADEPKGRFDLVICTHTMALIPVSDIEWFAARLYEFAAKAVFIAEKIGERKKREVSPGKATGWPADEWVKFIGLVQARHPWIETVLSVRERLPRGTITTRHIWRGGEYVGAFEAMPREQ